MPTVNYLQVIDCEYMTRQKEIKAIENATKVVRESLQRSSYVLVH